MQFSSTIALLENEWNTNATLEVIINVKFYAICNLERQLDCGDFYSKVLHVHLAKLWSRAFSVCFNIMKPISCLWDMTKAVSNYSELPLKASEEDNEEMQEVTVNIAAAAERD